jgi:hypothetical protein
VDIYIASTSSMTMEVNSSITLKLYVSVKTLKQMILERVHQVIMTILHTVEIDMADTVAPIDILDSFLADALCTIYFTYHVVLKALPGAAIFGHDMLFDIPYIDDWNNM